jgi:CheY-like chemotaxis protein
MSVPSVFARPGREVGESPKSGIGVRVLLVSGDIQIIDTLCHFMEQLAMNVEVCSDFNSATRKLCHAKFEGVIVDFKDVAKALEFVKKSREMTSHRGAVVVAILNSSCEMPSAFRAGASFTLVRPLPPPRLIRTLRAAYSLMVRERRRYYRCPLQIPVHVSPSSRNDFVATAVNISEGGMALATSVAMQVGERVHLRLTLPGTDSPARISSEVCWNDNAGRVGLGFVHIPGAALEKLQSWLADRLEESLPEEGRA